MQRKMMIRFCLCVAVLFFSFDSLGAETVPSLNLHVNGGAGGLSLGTAGDLFTITADTSPGSLKGKLADWWLAYKSPAGWYSLNSSGWIPGINLLAQYPLVSISPVVIYSASLSAGDYTFYFLVDTTPDGIVDSPYYFSSVQVLVKANISGSWAGTISSDYGAHADLFASITESVSKDTSFYNNITGYLSVTNQFPNVCGVDLYIPITGTVDVSHLNAKGYFNCNGSNVEIDLFQTTVSGNSIDGKFHTVSTADLNDSGSFHLEKQ